jgi:dienelactone hydrolase
MPTLRGPRLAALLLAVLASAAGAEPTAPGKVVELVSLAPGVLHSGLGAAPDPTQTFELYLPQAFTPTRRWPLLMVFDPRSRGRLAAEIFLPAAEARGWIVASSNNTMSDGPFDPNLRAVNAMFPDLMARLPVDPNRVYAAGFSGGGMLAWLVGVQTGRLAGVISVGGRLPDGLESRPPTFALWAAAGTADFNFQPTADLDARAARAGVPHRLEHFPGPHSWFDSGEARRAVDWLETVAMAAGLRARDESAIDAALAADRAEVEARAAAGDPLAAARGSRAIVETYRGLREVAADERRAAELAATPAARAAEKDEKWALRYEEQGRRRIAEALALLRSDQPLPSPAKLRGTIDLGGLLAQSRAGGRRGQAAERVLASVATQFGFYLMRQLFAAGDFATGVAALSLAVEARPRDPFLWYNLACAQARIGSRGAALVSLGHALDAGLPRPEQMASDPDLESLRAEPGFEALLARARAAPAGP